VSREVHAAVDRNAPNKPLPLPKIVIDAHLTRRLDDLIDGPEVREKASETSFCQRAVLGSVGAIHTLHVVERRRLSMPRRRRSWAATGRSLEKRLQVITDRVDPLLGFRSVGRNSSVGRVDDQGRTAVGKSVAALNEELVVGASDIFLRSTERPILAARACKDFRDDLLLFFWREDRLVREPGRPLQWR
jgi:hypothetical protein